MISILSVNPQETNKVEQQQPPSGPWCESGSKE
jgi:hypothetical protein